VKFLEPEQITMREQVLRFGSNNNLVGIFTEPKAEHRILGIPGAIMWNVGIHHRVGPNRVYVDLCRKLANQGYSSLRFDASGLGDSEASRAESGSDNERACLDVQAAMKLMAERTKHSQVILVSFCSGTDSAHAVASSDSRVAGLVCIEGYRFRTRGYYARYATRALDIGVWKRFVRRRMPQLIPPELREPKTQSQAGQEQVFVRDYISLASCALIFGPCPLAEPGCCSSTLAATPVTGTKVRSTTRLVVQSLGEPWMLNSTPKLTTYSSFRPTVTSCSTMSFVGLHALSLARLSAQNLSDLLNQPG